MQFSGQAAPGNRSNYREQQRARFPCDNCGQMGHWRSEIVCPNYHVFLSTQQAAAAAYHNNRSGGQGAGNITHQAGGNSGAVVPYKGMKHIVWHIRSFIYTGSCPSQQIYFGQAVITKSRLPHSCLQDFPTQVRPGVNTSLTIL